MKYVVTYEETLARTVVVEADSFEDAEDKVLCAVEDGRIVLDADDYLCDSGGIAIIDKADDKDIEWYGWYEEID